MQNRNFSQRPESVSQSQSAVVAFISAMASSMISWFVFVMIFASQTKASHFRGGIITWKPDEYIGNKVI